MVWFASTAPLSAAPAADGSLRDSPLVIALAELVADYQWAEGQGLTRLAHAVANSGDCETAAQVASRIPSMAKRFEALRQLGDRKDATAEWRPRCWQTAGETALGITDSRERSEALLLLAATAGERSENAVAAVALTAALDAIGTLRDAGTRLRLGGQAALMAAQFGGPEIARRATALIEDDVTRVGMMDPSAATGWGWSAAAVAAQSGKERGEQWLERFPSEMFRPFARGMMAVGLATLGRGEMALEVARAIAPRADGFFALWQLSEVLIGTDQLGAAREAAHLTVEAAQQTEAPYTRIGNLLIAIPLLAMVGEGAEAVRLAQAQDDALEAEALVEIASRLTGLGENERARTALDAALERGAQLPPLERVEILEKASRVLYRLGEGPRARRLILEEALPIATAISEADRRRTLRGELARTLVAVGGTDEGLAVAEGVLAGVTGEKETAEARSAVLWHLLQANRRDDALAHARATPAGAARDRDLYLVASAYAQHGAFEQALAAAREIGAWSAAGGGPHDRQTAALDLGVQLLNVKLTVEEQRMWAERLRALKNE